MNCACNQLLAGSRFSLNQYGGIGCRNLLNALQRLGQCFTVANDLIIVKSDLYVLTQIGVFLFQLFFQFLAFMDCIIKHCLLFTPLCNVDHEALKRYGYAISSRDADKVQKTDDMSVRRDHPVLEFVPVASF